MRMRRGEAASSVDYPHPAVPDDPRVSRLQVRRLWPIDLQAEAARRTLALLGAAYEREFEPPDGANLVPPGAVARRFNANDSRAVRAQRTRMRDAVAGGSAYWVVVDQHESAPGRRYVALAKTSPSRATVMQKARLSSPNCYVNDVVVRPELQRRGYGSMVLHAATKFGGYDLDKPSALDTYLEAGSFAFWDDTPYDVAKDALPPKLATFTEADEDHAAARVTMVRMVAPTLGEVVAALEERTPALRDAVPQYSSFTY